MKLSIEDNATHENPGKPWLKKLAEKLRNWLDNFLRKTIDSRTKPAPHPDTVVGNITARNEADNRNTQPEASITAASGSSELNVNPQAGPPSDWLERVRKGAPQLLLPVERGGTAWERVTQAAIETSLPSEDDVTRDVPEAGAHQSSSSSENRTRPTILIAPRRAVPRVAAAWFRRFAAKLTASWSARALKTVDAVTPAAQSKGVNRRLTIRQEPGFRHERPAPTHVTDDPQPIRSNRHGLGISAASPQRVRRDGVRPYPLISAPHSVKSPQTKAVSNEPLSSGKFASDGTSRVVEHQPTLPKWPPAFSSAEPPIGKKHWPLAWEATQSEQDTSRKKTNFESARGRPFSAGSIFRTRDEKVDLISAPSRPPESKLSPWPALPDATTNETADWNRILRDWAHAQMLDREQRGRR